MPIATDPLIQSTSKMSTKKNYTMKEKTLIGVGNLIKLLPSGTVFIYQILNPVVTNNGQCQNVVNKYLSGILIGLSALSCCFSSFTDSYTDSNGDTQYGIVTMNGLWPKGDGNEDLSKYKLRIGDFVHAFFALNVFLVLSLLDPNTVKCLYPSFESTQKVLLMVLPPVLGSIAGTVFVVFPNNRHGIGYPTSNNDSSS
ncbi:DUF679 domain membrane protein 2 [Heracleum sosnowskyi]|uniref:DUF679 domain membrane protein 2 n=1 Tax=Heracleum sosnowskyi TaxID=360622 RepID=A0AAD8MP11_9APIA|nr:DUF679 domain membrane protein 2 [Heracleum sosnowskyi]